MENALNLQEESAQKPEVPSCNPCNACNRLCVREVRSIKLQAEFLPMVSEHKGKFIAEEWPVVVGEANPAVELRIAGHALLNAWHADQNEADFVAVEEIAQIFQGDGIEAFRLVKDDQFHIFPRQGTRCLARVLVDADIDAAEQLINLVPQRAEIGRTSGRFGLSNRDTSSLRA